MLTPTLRGHLRPVKGAARRSHGHFLRYFEKLKLPEVLNEVVISKRGLVLVVGATGSGKSTSLAAMIDHRNRHSAGHIITVEDPVEYVHPSQKSLVTHREVGVDSKSWHHVLKNTLRQAPDALTHRRPRRGGVLQPFGLKRPVLAAAHAAAWSMAPSAVGAECSLLKQLVCLLALCCGLAAAPWASAQDAAALRAHHVALHDALVANAFKRPLVIESSEPVGGLQGDIYARIEKPFAVVSRALQNSDRWCDILMLHLDVKQCRADDTPLGTTLALIIGSRYDQPLANAYHFEFAYRVVAAEADYLQVVLSADHGPLGTSRYRIVLEVVALDARRSFLHMSYAYDYGFVARVAMAGYLATIGRNKVGFSVVGHTPDGQPQYIAGMRGVVERNTMRYYLAIEAYLGALSLPPAQQAERRLTDWYAGIERYPRQLHELELGEYLALKRAQMHDRAAPAQACVRQRTDGCAAPG